jgi:hypothetical protein
LLSGMQGFEVASLADSSARNRLKARLHDRANRKVALKHAKAKDLCFKNGRCFAAAQHDSGRNRNNERTAQQKRPDGEPPDLVARLGEEKT